MSQENSDENSSAARHPGEDKAEEVTDPKIKPASGEARTVKEPTIPSSIRLWESAYNALKALMAKYGKNMTEMTSICIFEYAKKAAAAATVKFRTMEDKTLFALQASATDIRTGLSNLREDLYQARKSHRDPAGAKAIYEVISGRYQKTIDHAEETLDLMAKELCLTGILADANPEILSSIIEKFAQKEPTIQLTSKERKILLEILTALQS